MSRELGVLLDDVRHPPVRAVLGRLLSRSETADFAVARIRLAAVDLQESELANVRRCRVLVGRLDAQALTGPAEGSAIRPDRLRSARALGRFLTSGRIEIRSSGVVQWFPDFSILAGPPPAPPGGVCLVGAHYFAKPFPTRGPALTCLLTGAATVASARRRFEALWEQAYDVLPVVAETLAAVAPAGDATDTA